LKALEHGRVGEVIHHLETLATEQQERAPAIAEVVRKTANYFRQRHSQVEYPGFVAAGYQIGSGLAESACKRFGTDRMKGAGMRWTVTGAESRSNITGVCASVSAGQKSVSIAAKQPEELAEANAFTPRVHASSTAYSHITSMAYWKMPLGGLFLLALAKRALWQTMMAGAG
jgi:hypothetical protein